MGLWMRRLISLAETFASSCWSKGDEPSAYGWYLEMLREGVPPSAGFGIGVERLTRYVSGLENIWDAVPFPKVPGVASP